MKDSARDRRCPRPDDYDALWRLLPVFIAFLTLVLVFADSAGR